MTAACNVTKGLLLHVDPPVKQIILDLDSRNSNGIVLFELVVGAKLKFFGIAF